MSFMIPTRTCFLALGKGFRSLHGQAEVMRELPAGVHYRSQFVPILPFSLLKYFKDTSSENSEPGGSYGH
jgi:hypothetical protein